MFKRILTLMMVAAMSSNAVKINDQTEPEVALFTQTESEAALNIWSDLEGGHRKGKHERKLLRKKNRLGR